MGSTLDVPREEPEMSPEITPFVVADRAAWRAWLDANEESSDGVWLLLAKKGTTEPTTLSYAEALDEALCSGWIDGQKRSHDAACFLQRFTPRRRASLWSQRNIGLVEGLIGEGRMRARGQSEIDRAKADGRACAPPRRALRRGRCCASTRATRVAAV